MFSPESQSLADSAESHRPFGGAGFRDGLRNTMFFGGPRRRRIVSRMLLIIGLLAVSLPTLLPAQTQPVAVKPAPKPAEITMEQVEAAIKQAEESKDIDDATRMKVLDRLRQVQSELQRAQDLNAKAELYQQEADSVAERVRQVKLQQDAFSAQPEPSIPKDKPLAELEQELSQRDAKLAELKQSLTDLQTEPTRRVNRRKELRGLLISAPERLGDLKKQLEAPPPADESALLTAARQMELRARSRAIESESPASQNELTKYDAEEAADLVRSQRDLLVQQIAREEKQLAALRDYVNQRRRDEAEERVHKARLEAFGTDPLVREYAKRNQELAEKAQQVIQQIESTSAELSDTKTTLDQNRKQFTQTKKKVQAIGLTGPIGVLLRKQRLDLPKIDQHKRKVSERRETIDDVHFSLFAYDEERSELADIEPLVKQILAQASPKLDDDRRSRFETAHGGLIDLELAVRDVLTAQREILDSLNRSYSNYFDALLELDNTERQLISETERYMQYVDERVLWIRSSRPLTLDEIPRDGETLKWLANTRHWKSVGTLLWEDLRANPVTYASALVLFGSLFYFRRRFRLELAEIGGRAQLGGFSLYAPTLRATLLTILISLPYPGLLAYFSWRLNDQPDASPFVLAVSAGLLATAISFLPWETFRQVCRKRGLAESHFNWSSSAVQVLRTNLRWLLTFGLPLCFVTAAVRLRDHDPGRDAVERLCFVLSMLLVAFIGQRVLRPSRGVFYEIAAYNRGGWIDRLRLFWFVLGAGTPLLLVGLAVCGYYYTALHLAWKLTLSIWLLMLLLVVRSLLVRWVLVHRRRLIIQQARERRAALEEQQGETATAGAEAPVAEPASDLNRISIQTQRLLVTGLSAVFVVGIWFVWVDVLPALEIFDRWPLWHKTVQVTEDVTSPTGELSTRTFEKSEPVTIADLAMALLIGALTAIAARNLPGLLEISLLQRLPLDASVRFAITTLSSYLIVAIGVLLATGTIGIGWSQVQWLAAALTFGLAFGLQEIFANFVSGLIILFERPVRVGDIVTVDDISGTVSRIRIRATTITNWDRRELVVPNKEFITGRVLNWTLTDSVNRMTIEVGIAYGSDTAKATELLYEITDDNPIVLKDPAPNVTFEKFGDSTLNFALRCYLPDLSNFLHVKHELHCSIDKAFRKAGIEIAFPQRDLHVRSLPGSLMTDISRASQQKPDGHEGANGDPAVPQQGAERSSQPEEGKHA